MQPQPLAIAGVGLATPLGIGAECTWDALLSGRFISIHSLARLELPAGGCRVSALARRVMSEATEAAGWDHRVLSDARTALVVGTSKGPIESWIASQAVGVAGLAELARELAVGPGPRLTLASACASGLHAVIRAALMLRGGEADRAVVVGAESSLHPLFLGSFHRLGVLPPEGTGCRPFDEARAGFLMSEAAGAICLERARPADPRVCIERMAMGAYATHLTAADPQGATLRGLLHQVIDGREVDLVHAHGTGTLLNDPAELAAIESCLPEGRPLLYSHKAALGHSLGASGLVSIALSVLMHRHGIVPGNVRTPRPLPTRKVEISAEPRRRTIRRSVALAAGFGGSAAAVSLVSGT